MAAKPTVTTRASDAVEQPQPKDSKNDLQRLQGTWVAVYPKPGFWSKAVRLEVADTKVTFKNGVAGLDWATFVAEGGSLELDTSSQPRRIALTVPKTEKKAARGFLVVHEVHTTGETETLHGLYEFEGERLKVCLNTNAAEPKPEKLPSRQEFEASRKQGKQTAMLLEFEREKKEEKKAVFFPLFQTYEAGTTLPSGRYLEHPPQYFPSDPLLPLPRELAAQAPAGSSPSNLVPHSGATVAGVPPNSVVVPVGQATNYPRVQPATASAPSAYNSGPTAVGLPPMIGPSVPEIIRLQVSKDRELSIEIVEKSLEVLIKGDGIVRIMDPAVGKAYRLDSHNLELSLADDASGLGVALEPGRPMVLKRQGRPIAAITVEQKGTATKEPAAPKVGPATGVAPAGYSPLPAPLPATKPTAIKEVPVLPTPKPTAIKEVPALPTPKPAATKELPQVLPASKPAPKAEPPSDEEALRALPGRNRNLPEFYKETRKDVQIVKECIKDSVASPRVYPQVGSAQLHEMHWKCSVQWNEQVESSYPFPFRLERPRSEVVYIDKDSLILDKGTAATK